MNKPYSTSPIFTATSLPAALRKAHNTKENVWGVLKLLKGTLLFTIEETGIEQRLQAPTNVIIIPKQYHFVTPISDDMEMQIDFYREKPQI